MKRARFLFLLAICLMVSMVFGGTALADEPLSHPPSTPSYTLSATGEGQIQTIYKWSIDKTVDTHGDVNISVGESQVVDYVIEVGKNEETGFGIKVTGTLSMKVNAEDGLDVVSITGKLHKSGGSDYGLQILASNQHFDPRQDPYTFDYSFFTTDHLGPGVYRLEFEVDASNDKDRDAHKQISFSFVNVNDTVTVTDAVTSGLPIDVVAVPNGDYLGTWPDIAGNTSIHYKVEFTNNGNKSGNSWTYDNTATIQETQQQDSVSVPVSVPKVSTPKPKPKPRDRSTPASAPTAMPTALDAASVALPRTGGLIEWEWITLAGGMLSGCGGGLYLLRRRMKK